MYVNKILPHSEELQLEYHYLECSASNDMTSMTLVGAGGQEAALFSKEMLDMYQR